MDNPTSLQLLMIKACLATTKEKREEAVRQWEEQVIINELDFASSRLIPYFFYRNQEDGITTIHDKRIKVIYKHWWLRTQHINHQLTELHAALTEAGIKIVVIKGASIKMYYKDETLRPMADFDLLVHPNDLPPTFQILKNLNYLPNKFMESYWEKNSSLFVDFNHAIFFEHQINNTQIDLHWKVGSECSTQFTDQLWLHLENYELIPNAKKPQLAYEVFMLIIHAVYAEGRDNLNWIIDIAVINAQTDLSFWKEARELAVTEKKEDLFDYGCSILIELGVYALNPGIVKKPRIFINTGMQRRKQMNPIGFFFIRIQNMINSVNRLFPHANIFTKFYYIARRIHYALIFKSIKP